MDDPTHDVMTGTVTGAAIPTFYLYGEPHRAVQDGFIHVEQLDDRSRASDWKIKPHAHADLAQLFVVGAGGGTMQADERALSFRAPAVLVVPAGVVHGFSWRNESSGAVVTLSQSYLSQVAERFTDIAAIFVEPRALALEQAAVETMLESAAALQQELGWGAAGHHAAVEAQMLGLLVSVLRQFGSMHASPHATPGQQAALVARYRERISARFRRREAVSRHAEALGTSETSLRAACARIARRSPAAILDERAMLEARRALRYTNLSVAEIGYAIGFGDPAYFSRFFTRHAGCSPRAYRRDTGG